MGYSAFQVLAPALPLRPGDFAAIQQVRYWTQYSHHHKVMMLALHMQSLQLSLTYIHMQRIQHFEAAHVSILSTCTW